MSATKKTKHSRADRRALVRAGARKGGIARARVLSSRRRKQIARQAALARWGRVKTKKTDRRAA